MGAGRFPLGDLADAHREMHDVLPAVHSSTCAIFRDIVRGEKLVTRHCKVFNEPLIYLFYGRPAYRSRLGATPSTDIDYYPVCFVFKSDRLPRSFARAFPFDSGAAKSDVFDPDIKSVDADSFQLNATFECLRRFTNLYFESNGKYFVGEARIGLVLPDDPHQAQQYYNFVTDNSPKRYDDRRSVIEVQYRDDLILRDTLWAVILPSAMASDARIRETIAGRWGALPLPYSAIRGASPVEFVAAVREVYMSLLRLGGFL